MLLQSGVPQFGVRRGGGCDFPSHNAESFSTLGKVIKKCAGVVFTDIRSAFCAAHVEIAIGALVLSQERDLLLAFLGHCFVEKHWRVPLVLPLLHVPFVQRFFRPQFSCEAEPMVAQACVWSMGFGGLQEDGCRCLSGIARHFGCGKEWLPGSTCPTMRYNSVLQIPSLPFLLAASVLWFVRRASRSSPSFLDALQQGLCLLKKFVSGPRPTCCRRHVERILGASTL